MLLIVNNTGYDVKLYNFDVNFSSSVAIYRRDSGVGE